MKVQIGSAIIRAAKSPKPSLGRILESSHSAPRAEKIITGGRTIMARSAWGSPSDETTTGRSPKKSKKKRKMFRGVSKPTAKNPPPGPNIGGAPEIFFFFLVFFGGSCR